MTITRAMLLAAGFGKRMRPLTLHRPKPLIEVAGRPLIDYAHDLLCAYGIETIVVNGHWLADRIRDWAKAKTPPPVMRFSDETDAILETGGGLKKALPMLGGQAVFVLNSDCIVLDGQTPALTRLAGAWDDARMDCLVLTVPLARAFGYAGSGDFVLDAQGRVRRCKGDEQGEIFTGVYVVHPRLFAHAPDGAFSMNVLFDVAMTQGRMYALSHDGLWPHVGTPDSIAPAARAIGEWTRQQGRHRT